MRQVRVEYLGSRPRDETAECEDRSGNGERGVSLDDRVGEVVPLELFPEVVAADEGVVGIDPGQSEGFRFRECGRRRARPSIE